MTTETAYQNTKTPNAGGAGHGCVSTREGHDAGPLPLVYGNALPVAGVVAVSILMAALLALFTWASFPSSQTGGRGVSAPVGGEVEIDIQGGFSMNETNHEPPVVTRKQIQCSSHGKKNCRNCYELNRSCIICKRPIHDNAIDGNIHWRCYREYQRGILA